MEICSEHGSQTPQEILGSNEAQWLTAEQEIVTQEHRIGCHTAMDTIQIVVKLWEQI